jgi:hypothetical protein
MILKQRYFPGYRKVQCAFKDLMIHVLLQFTLLIAIRCVLHRCENQEIHCQKLFLIYRNLVQFKLKQTSSSLSASHFQKETTFIQSKVHKRFMKSFSSIEKKRTPINFELKNDPTAGSPTVTLLRLLLPLNDQVWPTSLMSNHCWKDTKSEGLTKPFNR